MTDENFLKVAECANLGTVSDIAAAVPFSVMTGDGVPHGCQPSYYRMGNRSVILLVRQCVGRSSPALNPKQIFEQCAGAVVLIQTESASGTGFLSTRSISSPTSTLSADRGLAKRSITATKQRTLHTVKFRLQHERVRPSRSSRSTPSATIPILTLQFSK